MTDAMTPDSINFDTASGLVPVVVQDESTSRVIMMAWANREAVDLTLKTGYAHYYSRSRKGLWKKGETSGNLQEISSVHIDCDEDCLLYIVKQTGEGACHTGSFSCFYRTLTQEKEKG